MSLPDPSVLASQYPFLDLTPDDFAAALREDTKIRQFKESAAREMEVIEGLREKAAGHRVMHATLQQERKHILLQLRLVDGRINTAKARLKNCRRLIGNAEARINATKDKIARNHWAACKRLIQRRLIAQGKQLTVTRVKDAVDNFPVPVPPPMPTHETEETLQR